MWSESFGLTGGWGGSELDRISHPALEDFGCKAEVTPCIQSPAVHLQHCEPALSPGNYSEFKTEEWIKTVFLRILSSNLSVLCPRFLRTPRAPSEQTRRSWPAHPGPASTRAPGLGWFPMSHREHSILLWSCLCCAAREVWSVSLLPGCSWRNWGTCVCWPAGPCQTQCKTQTLTLFFLPGLQFGSLPSASFCETCRNHMVLIFLLFFQTKENCWNHLLSGKKSKAISRNLRGRAVRSVMLWLLFERGDLFENSKLNPPIQGKPDMNM